MDIFVTEKATGISFQFPTLPEKIDCKTGASFISYDIMSIGEVKIPLGEKLTGFSWDGMLPGLKRGEQSWIKYTIDPQDVQIQWSIWRKGGSLLHLLVTDTTINHDVYLEDYDMEYSGAFGDQHYSISFVHTKPLQVFTEAELNGSSRSSSVAQASTNTRSVVQPNTYTVVSGDSLWKIAQKFYGAGSRWGEIYDANKATIGGNPNLILPGMVLNIP